MICNAFNFFSKNVKSGVDSRVGNASYGGNLPFPRVVYCSIFSDVLSLL